MSAKPAALTAGKKLSKADIENYVIQATEGDVLASSMRELFSLGARCKDEAAYKALLARCLHDLIPLEKEERSATKPVPLSSVESYHATFCSAANFDPSLKDWTAVVSACMMNGEVSALNYVTKASIAYMAQRVTNGIKRATDRAAIHHGYGILLSSSFHDRTPSVPTIVFVNPLLLELYDEIRKMYIATVIKEDGEAVVSTNVAEHGYYPELGSYFRANRLIQEVPKLFIVGNATAELHPECPTIQHSQHTVLCAIVPQSVLTQIIEAIREMLSAMYVLVRKAERTNEVLLDRSEPAGKLLFDELSKYKIIPGKKPRMSGEAEEEPQPTKLTEKLEEVDTRFCRFKVQFSTILQKFAEVRGYFLGERIPTVRLLKPLFNICTIKTDDIDKKSLGPLSTTNVAKMLMAANIVSELPGSKKLRLTQSAHATVHQLYEAWMHSCTQSAHLNIVFYTTSSRRYDNTLKAVVTSDGDVVVA